MKASILNLFQCNPSIRIEKCIFDQNLKTLIFTFVPPLEQCALQSVVSLCLYLEWGQVIIWLFVATSLFNGAHLLNFGFEKVLELKDSIFKLILKPQHPNQLNYKEQIFSTLPSRRKNCLLLHLILPKVTFPQSTDQKIN